MPDGSATREHLERAHDGLRLMVGRTYDILTLRKPRDIAEAKAVAKVISKLSPFVANVLEAELILELMTGGEWPEGMSWVRQDPDFPDAILRGGEGPPPGVEIKVWFPFATEITGRFRESQAVLQDHNISVAVFAWLPEFILFGQPKIVGVFIDDALTFAKARDNHYFSPPEYLVSEPEDTTQRTRNLQQRNCNGLIIQASAAQLREAQQLVEEWGDGFRHYRTDPEFQQKIRELINRFSYRTDTNFSKIDRIKHLGLEEFKAQTLSSLYRGRTIAEWCAIIRSERSADIAEVLALADQPS